MTARICLDYNQSQSLLNHYMSNILSQEINKEILEELCGKYVLEDLMEDDELRCWLTSDQYQWVKENEILMVVNTDTQPGQVVLEFENSEYATEFALRWL